MSMPVTLTRRLATLLDAGCTSSVVTLCCTLSKGNDWKRTKKLQWQRRNVGR